MRGRRFFVPEVVQTSAMDCGPASLKSLLEGFRVRISYGRLREACQTDVDGTSIDTMEAVANQLGLEATQTMLPIDHLLLPSAEVFPCLIVVRTGNGQTHFVILWRKFGPWVQVMDPGQGRYWTRASTFLDNVYFHRQALPAAAWREWAGDQGHRALLGDRLAALGVGRGATGELLDRALADPTWKGFSDLDAAIRLVRKMVDSGAVPRRRSAALIRAFVEQPGQIPDSMRSVVASGDDNIALSGAVFVHAARRKEEGAAADLSPELLAALKEKPTPAARTLWAMVREDGLLTPFAVLLAMVAAAGGALLEGLLFRGMFDLARELGISGQRAAAFGAVLALLTILLLVEIPVVLGVLRMGRQLEVRMRWRFLSKLPRLGDRYFQSRPKSDMAERSHSLHTIRHLPEFASRILRTVFDLLFTCAGVVWLDPAAALPLAVYVAVALGIPMTARKALTEMDMRVRTHAGALGRFYLDSLLGLFPIRAHGAERSVRQAHRSLLDDWAEASLRVQRSVVALDGLQLLIGYGLGAWVIIDHFNRHGEVSTGLLFVYWVLGLPTTAQSLVVAAWQYPGYRNVALRLMEPLGALEEPLPEEVALPADAGRGMSIQLRGVSVVAGGHSILRDFDLDIRPGSHVAIVGPSGAGKSSFVGLLLGWHRPASGAVVVDGVELRGGGGIQPPQPDRVGGSRSPPVERELHRQPGLWGAAGGVGADRGRGGEGGADGGAGSAAGRVADQPGRRRRGALGRAGPTGAGGSRDAAQGRPPGDSGRGVPRPGSREARSAHRPCPRPLAPRHHAVHHPRRRFHVQFRPRAGHRGRPRG
jgi:ATP-binding cassette subfamily B protein